MTHNRTAPSAHPRTQTARPTQRLARLLSASSLASVVAMCALAVAAPEPKGPQSKLPTTLAVIGDSPYGAIQVLDFPNLVAAINADPNVERVVHVGDIKNGSSTCDDAYFATIEGYFAQFADSLVYTPGDNEWTDCHRSSNGQYDPLERLATLRTLFFSDPRYTLGGLRQEVRTQAKEPGYARLPENQAWMASRALFATVHVVGSQNGLAPWFGDNATDSLVDDPARRLPEVVERTQAAINWIDTTFDLALAKEARGVVVFMQADTWPGAVDDGYSEILARLADRAAAFRKPVLVAQGDSHVFKVDQPLLSGDPIHGITVSVPNLTRIVVQGATTSEWLELRVDPKLDALFSWQRMTRP
jgi:hypothetical protein